MWHSSEFLKSFKQIPEILLKDYEISVNLKFCGLGCLEFIWYHMGFLDSWSKSCFKEGGAYLASSIGGVVGSSDSSWP